MKKQKKSKIKRIKEISLPMKFNVGTLSYEPKLPIKKSENNKIQLKKKLKWVSIVILIMILLILVVLFYSILNKSL